MTNNKLQTNSKFQTPNSSAGTTLIEVLICMFLLAVMLVLYGAALQLVAVTKKLRNENVAYHIAGKQMEALRAIAFSALLPSSGTISDPLLSQIPSGSGSYTVSVYPSNAGIKELVVTVLWNDGTSHQVVFKTLSGNGGINP